MNGRPSGASAQERKFAEVYAATGHQTFAAQQAGYAAPAVAGSRLAGRPIVQEAIRNVQERRLVDEALPLAINWLIECVSSDKYKPADRNTSARIIVANTLGKGEVGANKAPEDMTPDELEARIALLRARQASLADGAKVIDGETEQIEDPAPEGDVFG